MLLEALLLSAVAAVLGHKYLRRRAQEKHLPPRDDPRWSSEPARQIAGRACAVCEGRIVTATEGGSCDACGAVAHVKTCLTRHVVHEHGGAAEPFR